MSDVEPRDDLELSIVLPCLNEAATLETCIRAAQTFLARNEVVGEVVVADNGSHDGSAAIAAAAGARVVDAPVRGYGAAVMAGVRGARGRYVVMADADGTYDLTALAPFLARLRGGDDLVMGNRFAGGIAEGAMPFLHRYLGNPVLTAIGRLFTGAACGDFHCGLRAFRRQALVALPLRCTGMEFASEMIVVAAAAGLRISDVPTTLGRGPRGRVPHLRTWRDGWRHLMLLLDLTPRWMYVYPGIALGGLGLLLLGGGAFGFGLSGPGGAWSTVMAGAAAVLVGCQALALGWFKIRRFAREGRMVLGQTV